MTTESAQLLELFRNSDSEMQDLIVKAVCMAAKHGDQFLMDAEPAKHDRAAYRAVIERYAAM